MNDLPMTPRQAIAIAKGIVRIEETYGPAVLVPRIVTSLANGLTFISRTCPDGAKCGTFVNLRALGSKAAMVALGL